MTQNPTTFIIVADIVIFLLCILGNLWATYKNINENVLLESKGFPRGSAKQPLMVHISWILAIGVIYANMPFDMVVNIVVCIILLMGGLAIQDKVVKSIIAKKVDEQRLKIESEAPKPAKKRKRKGQNRY